MTRFIIISLISKKGASEKKSDYERFKEMKYYDSNYSIKAIRERREDYFNSLCSL